MKSKLIIISISLLFCLAQSRETISLSYLDNVIPEDLIFHNSLSRAYSTIFYPGVLDDTTRRKVSFGLSETARENIETLNLPLTKYDVNRKVTDFITPYFLFENKISNLSFGWYLGKANIDFNKKHALSYEDTVRSFDNSKMELDAAFWIKPNIKYLKAVSFWTSQFYHFREIHFANITDLQRLHTHFHNEKTRRDFLLTTNFSFLENHFSLIKVGYGLQNIKASEKQLDSLYFTTTDFISSKQKFDNSYDNHQFNFEFGHIVKKNLYSFGFVAADKWSESQYKLDSKDSSDIYINGFFTREFVFQSISLFTGGNIKIKATLFNNDNSWAGFWKLFSDSKTAKFSKSIKAGFPFLLMFQPTKQLNISAGGDINFIKGNSNYHSPLDQFNISKYAGFNYRFYPFSFTYSPNTKLKVSIFPKIENNIFLSSGQLSYCF